MLLYFSLTVLEAGRKWESTCVITRKIIFNSFTFFFELPVKCEYRLKMFSDESQDVFRM